MVNFEVSKESVILRQLIGDHEYAAKYMPFLQPAYFRTTEYRLVFEEYAEYVNKYQHSPTKDELIVAIRDRGGNFDEQETIEVVNECSKGECLKGEWIH